MELAYSSRLLLMLAIIGANAFFAGAEAALISVRPSRLRQMAAEGAVGAGAALSLLAQPERLLSVVQVGVTLTSLALGWVGEDTLYTMFHQWLEPLMTPWTRAAIRILILAASFALMTFLHVVMGEVVPKNFALARSDRLAVLVAPLLLLFYRAVEPFVWAIERASAAVSRLTGGRGDAHAGHSREELKFILSTSRAAGEISEFELTAIERLLEMRDYVVREVMVPRNKLVMLPADSDLGGVLAVFRESRYSRLLVYASDPDDVLGAVHIKDVLDVWAAQQEGAEQRRRVPPFDLRRLLRKVPVVPEIKPLAQVLDEFRTRHAHLAIVVDEYGSLAGLITLEDVIEQVFGEIGDEFDPQNVLPPPGDREILVEGTISLVDLESQYGIELPVEEEYETLAGFLMFRLGRIPKDGDSVEEGGRRFTIAQMDRLRIAEVRIENAPAPPPPAETAA